MANRYQSIKVTRETPTSGSQYYVNALYPDIPETNNDYYIVTTIEDRLDLLAYQFYQDSSLWWILASANALPGDSLYPPLGVQLRIPQNPKDLVAAYKNVNNAI